MDALEDDSVYLIGLCGMGGIGKTTMANKIKKRTKSMSSMFEVVVFAVVSRMADLKKVQQQIAEGVGLRLEEDSLQIRAEKLHARLKGAKSFLIILDDVWEGLDLEKLGIPSKGTLKRRKLILTSRVEDALTFTNIDSKILRMDVLTGEEAWRLFRQKAGYSVDAPELYETAKELAKQCKGLPLALVVVGTALANKRKSSWEDALRQLKRNKPPENTPQVLQDLYVPLKWSYDQLQSEEARYIFLLCCLFPEDYEIPVELLVRYGWGLRVFSGVENLKEARDRVYGLVEMLKFRFLLIHAEDIYTRINWSPRLNEYVKMHDVIRDMAISIASRDRHVFMVSDDRKEWPRKDSYENYTHISVTLRGHCALPENINCPNLEFLRMELDWGKIEKPENFFDRMRGLKVLSAFGINSFPSSTCWPTNLRALHLHWCELEMGSLVSKLVNLEILSLQTSGFQELPKEVGLLKKLKLLDLTGCFGLRKIAPGLISGLVQLEELLMRGSSIEWEAEEEGKERRNASLAEVVSLKNLATLEITILDPKLISLHLPNGSELETYYVEIGNINFFRDNAQRYTKIVNIDCKEVAPIGNFFQSITRNAEYLELRGDGCIEIVNDLAVEGFQKVKELRLSNFHKVDGFYRTPSNSALFAALESFSIEGSRSLREICSGPTPIGSFGSLKQLCLRNLPKLKHAFPLSTIEKLSQLEKLTIHECDSMEEVFKEEGEVEFIANNKIKFLKLTKLVLERLPSIEVFCKRVEEIEFPALHTLEIRGLPKMTNFCHTKCILRQQFLFSKQVQCTINLKSLKIYGVNSIGIFSYEILKGNFSGLQVLEVESCQNLRNILAPSICRGLTNLRMLMLADCPNLEEVILLEEDREGQTHIKETLFPQLEELKLFKLPKFRRVCHLTNNLELPSLKVMIIKECPMLESFSMGFLNSTSKFYFNKEVLFPNLHTLELQKVNCGTRLFGNGIPICNFKGLEILRVESCCGLKILFSSRMSRGLANLKELELKDCQELEEVIDMDSQEGQSKIIETLLPQLKILRLTKLRKFHRFCHIISDLELPSLVSVTIEDCPIMETFSLGSVHLPSVKAIYGTQDPAYATKIFFNKEKSSEEIHRDNGCFILSARDDSIIWGGDKRAWVMYLKTDSSNHFVPVAELRGASRLEVKGKFMSTNLSSGEVYEILYIIMLDESAIKQMASVDFRVTLPEGIEHYHREYLIDKPSGEWLEIRAGEFRVEPNQSGELKFSLYQNNNRFWRCGLLIKGIKIRPKPK